LSAELMKTHSFRLFFWRFCPQHFERYSIANDH